MTDGLGQQHESLFSRFMTSDEAIIKESQRDHELASLNPEEAIKILDREIESNPILPDPWHDKGEALMKLGRYKEAIKACNQAVAYCPEHLKAWRALGALLKEAGRYYDSLTAIKRALELCTDYENRYIPTLMREKGECLFALEQYEEALNACEWAISIKPCYEDAWRGKGDSLYFLRRYEEALEAYERLLEINPESDYGQEMILMVEEAIEHRR